MHPGRLLHFVRPSILIDISRVSSPLPVISPPFLLMPFAVSTIIRCSPYFEQTPPYQYRANNCTNDNTRDCAAREAVARAIGLSREKLGRWEAGQNLLPSARWFEDANGTSRSASYHSCSTWVGSLRSEWGVDSITNPTLSTTNGILPVIRECIFVGDLLWCKCPTSQIVIIVSLDMLSQPCFSPSETGPMRYE